MQHEGYKTLLRDGVSVCAIQQYSTILIRRFESGEFKDNNLVAHSGYPIRRYIIIPMLAAVTEV